MIFYVHQSYCGQTPKKEQRKKEVLRQKTFAVALTEAHIRKHLPNFVEKNNDKVKISFGVAVVHPEDQFCKKTGRKFAKERMKSTDFRIVNVESIKDNNGQVWTRIAYMNKELAVGIEAMVNFASGSIRVNVGDVQDEGEQQHDCQGACSCQ